MGQTDDTRASCPRPLRDLELLSQQHPAGGPQDRRGRGPGCGTRDCVLRGGRAPEDLQGGGASGHVAELVGVELAAFGTERFFCLRRRLCRCPAGWEDPGALSLGSVLPNFWGGGWVPSSGCVPCSEQHGSSVLGWWVLAPCPGWGTPRAVAVGRPLRAEGKPHQATREPFRRPTHRTLELTARRGRIEEQPVATAPTRPSFRACAHVGLPPCSEGPSCPLPAHTDRGCCGLLGGAAGGPGAGRGGAGLGRVLRGEHRPGTGSQGAGAEPSGGT